VPRLTTLGALSKGLPQLWLPRRTESALQHHSAPATGAALALQPEEIGADTVAEAPRPAARRTIVPARGRPAHTEIDQLPIPAAVLHKILADPDR
jgi:hypothetical protein